MTPSLDCNADSQGVGTELSALDDAALYIARRFAAEQELELPAD